MKNNAMQGLFGNKDLLDGLGNYFNPAQADIEERIITPRGPDLGRGGSGVVSGGFSGGMFGNIASPMSAYGF
jgi:hypothetical protein